MLDRLQAKELYHNPISVREGRIGLSARGIFVHLFSTTVHKEVWFSREEWEILLEVLSQGLQRDTYHSLGHFNRAPHHYET